MADIFRIDRPTNKITLGTDATTIVVTPLTASKTLALNASKELVSVQDIRTIASPQFTGIELGHASDTTITRVGAGVIAVEGTNVMLVGAAPTAHTVASHNDTSGTGAELDTLTDNSMADVLHRHSELSASDGTPDQAVFVDAAGMVGIGTVSPDQKLHIKSTIGVALKLDRGADTNDGFLQFATGGGTPDWFVGLDNVAGSRDDFQIKTVNNDPPEFIINRVSGNVGMGGIADPHSKLEVSGAISSATLTVTTANDGADIDVSGVNYIFIDSSGGVISIDDFQGGVNGQILHIVIVDNTSQVTFVDTSGAHQEMFLHSEANLVVAAGDRGGVTLVCNGTHWYNVSHAKHVP